MKAELEITSGIIRVFSDGSKFGDPFELSVFVVANEKTAILKGLKMDGRLAPRHCFAIMQCLLEYGFTDCLWIRWILNSSTGEYTKKEVKYSLVKERK